MTEAAIYSRLTNNAPVSALVSTRVYPRKIPQSPTYPLISYAVQGIEQPTAMGSDPEMVTKTVQVDCYAATYSGAKDLSDKVRQALQRWRGTAAGVTIQGSFLVSEFDFFEDEIEVYRVTMDFDITFNR